MKLQTLIIDDNAVIHFLHSEIVADGGISQDPVTFFHGKEAIQYLNNQQQNVNAYFVLLDLNMPVMNGWQFLDELQNCPCKSRTFVIIVSSSVDASDKTKSKQYSQVIGYYEKPISEDDCEAIKQTAELRPFFI